MPELDLVEATVLPTCSEDSLVLITPPRPIFVDSPLVVDFA
jgi:hypothetical protein